MVSIIILGSPLFIAGRGGVWLTSVPSLPAQHSVNIEN